MRFTEFGHLPLVLSMAEVSLRTLSIDGMKPFHMLVREASHRTFRASMTSLTLSVSGISILLEILMYLASTCPDRESWGKLTSLGLNVVADSVVVLVTITFKSSPLSAVLFLDENRRL